MTKSRVEDMINDFLDKKADQDEKKTLLVWILAIVGGIAIIALIAYAIYRFFTPDYIEDFEDDFDDDFDDDYFEDDDDEKISREKVEELKAQAKDEIDQIRKETEEKKEEDREAVTELFEEAPAEV